MEFIHDREQAGRVRQLALDRVRLFYSSAAHVSEYGTSQRAGVYYSLVATRAMVTPRRTVLLLPDGKGMYIPEHIGIAPAHGYWQFLLLPYVYCARN